MNEISLADFAALLPECDVTQQDNGEVVITVQIEGGLMGMQFASFSDLLGGGDLLWMVRFIRDAFYNAALKSFTGEGGRRTQDAQESII